MSTEYSRGPWRLKACRDGFNLKGAEIKRTIIATVPFFTKCHNTQEQCANAILISQAPAILEALLRVEEKLKAQPINPEALIEEVGNSLAILRHGGICK